MQRARLLARMIVLLARAATDQVVNFSRCCVAPQKRLDVENYAFVLLFPVRLASKKIIRP